MKDPVEVGPVLRLIDTVIADLAVRSARYVGRRAQDGDAETFVIQDGEEGCLRLPLPNLSSPRSVVEMARAAQNYLCRELGEPVPRCPPHDHPLDLVAVDMGFEWACPAGRWRCALGEYAEQGWPQFDCLQLPKALSDRVRRRKITGVGSVQVTEDENGLIARFGVLEITPALVAALRDAAAPLSVEVHQELRRPIRVSATTDSSPKTALASFEPAGSSGACCRAATVRLELGERSVRRGGELSFAVVNGGTVVILIGGEYALDRRFELGWETIDPECWFALVGLIVDAGQRRDLVARIPARAAPGAYRLRKDVRLIRDSGAGQIRALSPNDPRM